MITKYTPEITFTYGNSSIQMQDTSKTRITLTSLCIVAIGAYNLANSRNSQYNALFATMAIGGSLLALANAK